MEFGYKTQIVDNADGVRTELPASMAPEPSADTASLPR